MTAVQVCLCDLTAGNKTSRFSVQFDPLNGNTEPLLSEIAKEIGCSESEIDVCYSGQMVDKSTALESLHLTPLSTLFVFRKSADCDIADIMPNLQRASEMIPMIQRAVRHPSYRRVVDHILTHPEEVQKMIAAVPGLDRDPIAMSMLQDPELLHILVNRHIIHKVLEEHPRFGPAAMYIASVVNKEGTQDAKPSRSNVYSMDQMSDEEDDASQGQRGAAARPPPQQILPSQLAAALAAATASAAQPSTSSTSAAQAAPGTSASGSSTSVISQDFFQQAMMTAQSAALEAQIQQLRDMGISDENVARQALTASGGDVQAALEFIFGDGGM